MNGSKFIVTLLLVALMSGCRESHSPIVNTRPAERTGAINPCSLLNREEIEAVLGHDVSEGKVQPIPRPNCEYAVGEGSVTVFVFNDPSAVGGFQTGKTMQDAKTEPVQDIGDQAYWSPDIQALNVLKGDTYFTVQYYRVPSGSKETMKALAQKALTRLP